MILGKSPNTTLYIALSTYGMGTRHECIVWTNGTGLYLYMVLGTLSCTILVLLIISSNGMSGPKAGEI